MRKKWTDEEIQFLKFAYPNKDFTDEEVYKAFEYKTKKQIKSKAESLGLKRYKEILPNGFKRCTRCDTILPLSDFSICNKNKTTGRQSHCKVCQSKRFSEWYKKNKSSNTVESSNTVGSSNSVKFKKCIKCKKVKTIDNFHKDSNQSDGVRSQCKDCKREYDRKRTIIGGY